jgi:hypothetical protein
MLPGAERVYDRSTKQLVACTPALCPLAERHTKKGVRDQHFLVWHEACQHIPRDDAEIDSQMLSQALDASCNLVTEELANTGR